MSEKLKIAGAALVVFAVFTTASAFMAIWPGQRFIDVWLDCAGGFGLLIVGSACAVYLNGVYEKHVNGR